MARDGLTNAILIGAGAFILGDIALKGAFGSSIQQGVARFAQALGFHVSVSVNPQYDQGSASSAPPPSTTSAGSSPPARCQFIPWGSPNAQFVQDNHDGTYTVVIGGRVYGTYTDLNTAQQIYNSVLRC